MSRNSKILIGLLSFLPIILFIVLIAMFFILFPTIFQWEHVEPEPGEVFSVFGPIFIVGLMMGLLSLGLLIFFIMHLIRNKKMEGTERVIWILVFLFAGMIGYPIYWYMRVWQDEL